MSKAFYAGSFAYNIRTQFSFFADDQALSRVLSDIAGRGISITGYLQTILPEYARGCASRPNLVRLVVGSPDSETAADIRGVKNALCSPGIEFEEDSIIQVLLIDPGVPGILNGIFGALWRRVNVNAMYLGEETRIFLDVSDIRKALSILLQMPHGKSPERG